MSWLGETIDRLDNPISQATPTRTPDSAFQPSATKWVLCSYVVQLAASAGGTVSVELRSDSATTPTTARDVVSVAPVGSGDSTTVKMALRYLCPPGHYVKRVSAGSTPTITAVQAETIVS